MCSNLPSWTRTLFRPSSNAIGAQTRGPTRRVFLTFPGLSALVADNLLYYTVIKGTTIVFALSLRVCIGCFYFIPRNLLFALHGSASSSRERTQLSIRHKVLVHCPYDCKGFVKEFWRFASPSSLRVFECSSHTHYSAYFVLHKVYYSNSSIPRSST